MLTQMLKQNQVFQKYTEEDQEIYLRLAHQFEQSSNYLFLSPEELPVQTRIGSKDQWQALLTLETTQAYIKGQMAQITQVAQRKAFLSLQEEARNGNVQAVKEINELSGIMEAKDNSRVIVLHRVNRKHIEEVN